MINSAYIKGISCFLMSLFVCETNDVITKFLGNTLTPLQVVFGRYLLSTIILLPIIFYRSQSVTLRYFPANCIRGLILFFGMFIWCYGLDESQLSIACLINFTTPMFTLLFAALLLKEKIGRCRIVATLLGFLGVAVVLNPWTATFSVGSASIFLASAICFAFLDVINKILVSKESILSSLFFTNLVTLIFTALAIMFKSGVGSIVSIFQTDFTTIALLCGLGIGANLLFGLILLAFKYIDVSATAPFRYVELILASTYGHFIFNEPIHANVVWGSLIIVPCAIYLANLEAHQNTHCC